MIRAIYAADGARGFMRGATARMLYYVPSAAICWSVRASASRRSLDAWKEAGLCSEAFSLTPPWHFSPSLFRFLFPQDHIRGRQALPQGRVVNFPPPPAPRPSPHIHPHPRAHPLCTKAMHPHPSTVSHPQPPLPTHCPKRGARHTRACDCRALLYVFQPCCSDAANFLQPSARIGLLIQESSTIYFHPSTIRVRVEKQLKITQASLKARAVFFCGFFVSNLRREHRLHPDSRTGRRQHRRTRSAFEFA